jgi:allophanate hydrolase
VRLAVVGAHLTGMPLNRELTDCQAVFVERTTTSAAYRLYALADTVPPKPGLGRTVDGGAAIEVELWDVPSGAFGSFVAGIPGPLGIGTIELADGREVKGFICEPWALARAKDITTFGGWRAYLAADR